MTYKLLTETERKEGMFFKFNESAILRTDAKTQAEILTSYVQNGVYTPNEARSYRFFLPYIVLIVVQSLNLRRHLHHLN